MTLRDKFDYHAHWKYFERIRASDPASEIEALIQTSEEIKDWPNGVKYGCHLPMENGRHLYTVIAATQAFAEFCERPTVLRLAL